MLFDGQRLEYLIDNYVNGKKSDRNRTILKEYYLHGFTYEEIAERVDMSAVQVGRIVRSLGGDVLKMI